MKVTELLLVFSLLAENWALYSRPSGRSWLQVKVAGWRSVSSETVERAVEPGVPLTCPTSSRLAVGVLEREELQEAEPLGSKGENDRRIASSPVTMVRRSMAISRLLDITSDR